MKMRRVNVIAAACLVAIVLMAVQSCEDRGNVTNISQAGGTESHNMGSNCMDCHKSGGEGKGWFTAAGTVYTPNGASTVGNAVVYLYTQPNGGGTLVATLYGDAKGNFYTTASIDYGSGLYPAISSAVGLIGMSTSTTNGACNSCHGVSNAKIYNQ